MPIDNQEIAAAFNEMADLLEIDNANPFRVRAYRNAAQLIANYSRRLDEMVVNGEDLTELPGIGADLAGKIKTLVESGHLPQLEQLEKQFPKEVTLMLNLKGLGPKRVHLLYEKLHIKTLADLEKAAKTHKIRELRGFGSKTETVILNALQEQAQNQHRYLYADVQGIAEEIVAFLKKFPLVGKVSMAGSYRRKKDTVGDLDILVTAASGKAVTDHFVKFRKVVQVTAHGETRATVVLNSGMQVDLRVVPEASFGAAMVYFTGSKAHNIAIRKIAISRQLKINEYGVFKDKQQIAGKTELDVYQSIDLPFIEPELREDNGEIIAAKQGKLPKLISSKDIRGDLHCHTLATDGRATIIDMAKAAQMLGYEYIAITDHTQYLKIVRGQDPERILAQIKMIDQLNEQLSGIRILKSAEIDILSDGTLDLPDDILKHLDLTVCSIHSQFDLPREKQTERILRAIDNRYFTILGHPSGRLINKRPPLNADYERIFTAIKNRSRFLEVNAQPERMDLTDHFCRMAKDLQIKVVISTDAHSLDQLNYMQYGIAQARRGWLEAKDVLNTYPLKTFLKMIQSS